MSLTWATWQTAVQTALKRSSGDANLTALLPDAVDFAEQRIYRELQLLTQVTTDASGSATAGNRNFTFPSHFVIAQEINILSGGTRVAALTQTSREALNFMWPSPIGSTVPMWWAPVTDQTIILGPWPDQNYTIEVVGTQRPTPLSAGNTTTWISTYLPDLFLTATLIFFSGELQGNFSATGDDPQGPMTYEKQYGLLAASAAAEEVAKKYGSQR